MQMRKNNLTVNILQVPLLGMLFDGGTMYSLQEPDIAFESIHVVSLLTVLEKITYVAVVLRLVP
jgi:hypothetical protein